MQQIHSTQFRRTQQYRHFYERIISKCISWKILQRQEPSFSFPSVPTCQGLLKRRCNRESNPAPRFSKRKELWVKSSKLIRFEAKMPINPTRSPPTPSNRSRSPFSRASALPSPSTARPSSTASKIRPPHPNGKLWGAKFPLRRCPWTSSTRPSTAQVGLSRSTARATRILLSRGCWRFLMCWSVRWGRGSCWIRECSGSWLMSKICPWALVIWWRGFRISKEPRTWLCSSVEGRR